MKILAKTPVMGHEHHNFYHGRLKHYPPHSEPRVTSQSWHGPRGSTVPWLSLTQYQERPAVLQDKLQYLVRLLLSSRKTLLLTGAGLRRSSRSRSVDSSTSPSPAHTALASLVQRRLVTTWVQLTPHGLAQKAGCPQQFLNEVYGSWYDPSNPVLRGKGRLRADLYERLLRDSLEADLVLVLGAPLSSTLTDILIQSPAERSLAGLALGSVIINTQQTELDGAATLRLFSPADLVTRLLLQALDLSLTSPPSSGLQCGPGHAARVRYDREGVRSDTRTTVLDLSPGSRVRLSATHNCQESGQAKLRHILRPEPELERRGRVLSAVQRQRRVTGEGRVVRFSPVQSAWELEVEGVKMLLGTWWMDAAISGTVDFLPLVNIEHKEESIATD